MKMHRIEGVEIGLGVAQDLAGVGQGRGRAAGNERPDGEHTGGC
jgi:hypothetical protein